MTSTKRTREQIAARHRIAFDMYVDFLSMGYNRTQAINLTALQQGITPKVVRNAIKAEVRKYMAEHRIEG